MPIQWKDSYNLGFQVIDNQHRHFVDMLNNLYEIINTQAFDKGIDKVVLALEDYAVLHFSTEEKYFEEFGYEFTEEHENAHKGFVKDFKNILKENEKDIPSLCFKLADFLEDWLVNHLKTMDRKYVDCFKKHGLH